MAEESQTPAPANTLQGERLLNTIVNLQNMVLGSPTYALLTEEEKEDIVIFFQLSQAQAKPH